MFRYLFDDDFSQRTDIESLKIGSDELAARLQRARTDAAELADRVAYLEDQLARHMLFSRTLLQVVLRNDLCTPEEFTALFKNIDLEDGVADGRITPADEKHRCLGCEREIPEDKTFCIYCGGTRRSP